MIQTHPDAVGIVAIVDNTWTAVYQAAGWLFVLLMLLLIVLTIHDRILVRREERQDSERAAALRQDHS